jgi:outer membrane lipopolysaccharide assembly protein LptE/RlpB
MRRVIALTLLALFVAALSGCNCRCRQKAEVPTAPTPDTVQALPANVQV